MYGYGFLSGRKRYWHEILHASGMSFSHFGELWLVGSHGGGITSGMSCIELAVGQSEFGAVAWWAFRIGGGGIASLLTHLFFNVYKPAVFFRFKYSVRSDSFVHLIFLKLLVKWSVKDGCWWTIHCSEEICRLVVHMVLWQFIFYCYNTSVLIFIVQDILFSR